MFRAILSSVEESTSTVGVSAGCAEFGLVGRKGDGCCGAVGGMLGRSPSGFALTPKVDERECIAALELKLKQLKVVQQPQEVRARTLDSRGSRRILRALPQAQLLTIEGPHLLLKPAKRNVLPS
jgi:hypothetical protein